MKFTGTVSIDGVLTPANEARISVFDRGFLYGDSAFEAMRTYGKTPFRGREHFERLQRSCARLVLPVRTGPTEWAAEVQRAIEASGLAECYVRVVITRGVGPLGLDLSTALEPSVVCYALELEPLAAEFYTRGVALGLAHTVRVVEGTAAQGAKASNYLASLLALHEVKARGCHEALLLGPDSSVLEGATSNVFALRGGALYTPPIEAGILAGITRLTVLELAAELGIAVHETRLTPDDLWSAEEVFITSSVREIVPVVRIDERPIAGGQPGPGTARLLAAYRARTLQRPRPELGRV